MGEVMRPWAETVVRRPAEVARMEVEYFILFEGSEHVGLLG